jgi:exopolysaccharide biosynthesis polyprenyl glycosylphosphotransferase
MGKFQNNLIYFVKVAADQLVMIFCFVLAASFVVSEVDGVPLSQFFYIRLRLINFIIFLLFMIIWHINLSLHGAYYSKRIVPWKSEASEIFYSVAIGAILLLVYSVIFKVSLITPTFLLVFWLSSCVLTTGGRMIVRFIITPLRLRGININNILIVGTNSRAVQFAKDIESQPELGYRVVGFVDNEWAEGVDFKDSGYKLVAGFHNFPAFLRKNVIDEVVIDLPLNTFYHEAMDIVDFCVKQGVVVRFISDSFYLLTNMNLARSVVEEFHENVLITIYTGAMGGWPIMVKRVFDFVGSLLLIGIFSPVLLIISLLILATSGRPVFFIQERMGINKRIFPLFKFRTMVANAQQRQAELERFNEADGPVFKIKKDPRVTLIGRFLRKTSLDELPQLFNVLRGEMSLVGPRPLPVRDYKGFNQDWHRRRFSVKPGITCMWQIRGRSSLSFEQWMKLDIYYIDHWSLWLDFKILVLTIPEMLWGDGAY